MAAVNPVKTLQDEATCSICLDYYKDPLMIIDCGHNFCRACIIPCGAGVDANVSCPCCRGSFPQRNLKPNRQLANVADVAKHLSLQSIKDPGDERVCEKHQEVLKLFCEEDQILICVVCDRSKEHRAHAVVPIEEAAQELRRKMETAEKFIIQSTVETERQKVESEFKQLHLFLEEQEQRQLDQLSELDQKIVKTREENATKYSDVFSCLSELVCEMEGKCQQPASEFLQVRLGRWEAGTWGVHVLNGEMKGACGVCNKFVLKKLMDDRSINVNVTFDPATAHPRFVVSECQKSVSCGDERQNLSYSPQRFDPCRCVLGREGFTSGRHCWEVMVGNGGFWAVGVARESVERKGQISLDPEEGIWAIGLSWGQYRVLTSPVTFLSLSNRPTRIAVLLNYEMGLVTFVNVGTMTEIFSFPQASFAGERLFPFFRVGDTNTCLRLLP
uniref:RING-type E3 ubiquitin transferase n=1 Tax=Pelusios castaneus TaxID=367368 RepID=A0A8C8RDM2_9SAUR